MQSKLWAKSLVPYPSKLFHVTTLPEKVTIVGHEAIGKIIKYLRPDLKTESATVIDANPGKGVLARSLLDAGLPTIHLLSKVTVENPTNPHLEKLKDDYHDRVQVHDTGIAHHEDENLSEIIAKTVPCDSWPQIPPLKVILPMSPLKENRITNSLMNHFIYQSGLFCCGRTDLYVSTSYYLAAKIAADYSAKNYKNYQCKSVLFQILFDWEILDKIPWEEFDPYVSRKKITSHRSSDYFSDHNNAFLFKLTPKATVPDLIPFESLPEFAFFVRQSMIRRTNFIIPFFEKWFPGCGPRLIKAGIPLFSKFGDTSPNTFLELYNLFTQWPEYSTSTFKAASSSHHQMLLYDDSDDDILTSSTEELSATKSQLHHPQQ